MAVTVRFFAAAREAAGCSQVQVPAGAVIPELLALDLGPRFAEVLRMCSVMCDGLRLGLADEASDGAVVDVLPPFAGG